LPALAMQFVFNIGLALIMARLGSNTPDLAQLMPFIMRTWMYASGVMFSISVMLKGKPEWITHVLMYNPAAIYMDLIRFALIDGYGASNLPPHVWVAGALWAVLLGVAGFVYFWKAEERYGRG
jgi:teichoic acid transport system permease protein